MPVFIAALIGGLVSAAGSFVGRALIALGVGVVAYSGINTAMDAALAIVVANGNALPTGIVGMLGVLKIGTGLNIIMSALVIRWTLQGLTSGVVKRFVLH